MRRRTFLLSTAIASLAGCSSSEPSEPTETGTATGTSTGTVTGTSTGTAEFEFEGVDAPDTVELNEPVSFAVRVRNVGSGRGTFTSGLSARVGDGEWRTLDGQVKMPLDAGESGVWKSPEITPRYLTSLTYRLDAVDETWTTEVVPKRLTFAEEYATPSGLLLTVLGGNFESSYPDENGTPAPEGSVWAVMRVDVRNRLQEAQPAPDASTFALETDGEVQEMDQSVTDDPYEGGSLAGRGGRRGDLVYAVPEGTTGDDLSSVWEQSTDRGDLRVVWSK